VRLTKRNTHIDPASIRLPIVALVDVVLFLLLYFMVAGTLAQEEAELASGLKTAEGQSVRAQEMTSQIVRVSMERGRPVFTLSGRALSGREELGRVLAQLPKDLGVTVSASAETPVAYAAAALQTCRDAGFTKVSYLAPK
jgi:biopolymer transport protein ExbD